jgi:hypothetical protein
LKHLTSEFAENSQTFYLVLSNITLNYVLSSSLQTAEPGKSSLRLLAGNLFNPDVPAEFP